jgi:hypothetical protein
MNIFGSLFTIHGPPATVYWSLPAVFLAVQPLQGRKGKKKQAACGQPVFKGNISTGLVGANVAMARIGTRSEYDDKTDCCCCQSGQGGGAEAYASGSGRGSSDGNTSGAGAGGSSCAGAASCGCLIGCHAHGCTDQQYTANDHYRNNLFHSVSSP